MDIILVLILICLWFNIKINLKNNKDQKADFNTLFLKENYLISRVEIIERQNLKSRKRDENILRAIHAEGKNRKEDFESLNEWVETYEPSFLDLKRLCKGIENVINEQKNNSKEILIKINSTLKNTNEINNFLKGLKKLKR